METIASDIAGRLRRIGTRIATAARAAGRDPAGITLVAVSKTHGADRVSAALAAGQRIFGENRVQEAAAKFAAIMAAEPGVRLHLIGPIQSNKAREAVRVASVIESLDRPKLLRALADAVQREGRSPGLLVQVNVGAEPQKAGVGRDEADAFIAACRAEFGRSVLGVMAIPPADHDPTPHFAWLAACARRNGLAVVSMGMSADFEIAIAEGASHIRVGHAIFGDRPPPR